MPDAMGGVLHPAPTYPRHRTGCKAEDRRAHLRRRGRLGGLLCESYEYLKQSYPKRTTAQDRTLQERTFYGKEKKSLAYVIAIMNMILHGIRQKGI
jgi:hypothetical protein